jgi:hypothetical protein
MSIPHCSGLGLNPFPWAGFYVLVLHELSLDISLFPIVIAFNKHTTLINFQTQTKPAAGWGGPDSKTRPYRDSNAEPSGWMLD